MQYGTVGHNNSIQLKPQLNFNTILRSIRIAAFWLANFVTWH